MTSILLVDDSAVGRDLFGAAIRDRLGYDVHALAHPGDVTGEFLGHHEIDVALVDLSYDSASETAIDALLRLHLDRPTTKLIALTRGGGWTNDLVRDAWEAFPLASVIGKDSPVHCQLEVIQRVVVQGYSRPDPRLSLPVTKSPWRTLDGFGRLVQHKGHAKLWATVLACGPDAGYADLVAHSGLRSNALRNYRAQLLPELSLHGLKSPKMRDLHGFALRSRPFLAAFVKAKGVDFPVDASWRSQCHPCSA